MQKGDGKEALTIWTRREDKHSISRLEWALCGLMPQIYLAHPHVKKHGPISGQKIQLWQQERFPPNKELHWEGKKQKGEKEKREKRKKRKKEGKRQGGKAGEKKRAKGKRQKKEKKEGSTKRKIQKEGLGNGRMGGKNTRLRSGGGEKMKKGKKKMDLLRKKKVWGSKKEN